MLHNVIFLEKKVCEFRNKLKWAVKIRGLTIVKVIHFITEFTKFAISKHIGISLGNNWVFLLRRFIISDNIAESFIKRRSDIRSSTLFICAATPSSYQHFEINWVRQKLPRAYTIGVDDVVHVIWCVITFFIDVVSLTSDQQAQVTIVAIFYRAAWNADAV